MKRRRKQGTQEFERRLENTELLESLLATAGSPLDAEAVLARFRTGRSEGLEASEVIPTLFPAPPRFADPDIARRLFQNLLGLWEASAATDFRLPVSGPKRKATARLERPGQAGPGEPDLAYVLRVRTWLSADPRGRGRLHDSFENRQDTLLGSLDERGLSDEGWAVLRHLAFELHAVLELADGAAPASVPPVALAGTPTTNLPVELQGLVDQAIASTEQDLAGPVPESERAELRVLGRQVLGALWAARARR
jgi:hypothetical protein